MTGVIAHQGGWDEALVVVLPLGIFGTLLWAATVRAGAHRDSPDDGPPRP